MDFSKSTIAIYSVGLLGGSMGLALKQSGFKGRIIGLSSPDGIEKALKLGCIDEGYGYENLKDVVNKCDVLFLCSPINTIIETIGKISQLEISKPIFLTDVGSTKEEIVKIAKVLPSNVHFIGGHPMAGSEKSGPAASDPFLFQNAIYVLTPQGDLPDDDEKAFASFLEKNLGCRTLFLKSSTHDLIAATVSHVPHLLAVALVLLARQTDDAIPGALTLAAGGFRDMTRIASAGYPIWHDILVTNKKSIEKQLDEYINVLHIIKKSLQENSLEESFTKSRETRSRIPLTNKGFIKPLSEVLIHAKDQPGFLSSMAAVLAGANINIKDIELIKVREGEGGTIRLAFESSQIARNAISVLLKNGFIARERT